MQGGVIGGICLLAFLLSVGQADDSDDTKQTAAPDTIEVKKADVPVEDDVKRSNKDLVSSKVVPDDLKADSTTLPSDVLAQSSSGPAQLKTANIIDSNIRKLNPNIDTYFLDPPSNAIQGLVRGEESPTTRPLISPGYKNVAAPKPPEEVKGPKYTPGLLLSSYRLPQTPGEQKTKISPIFTSEFKSVPESSFGGRTSETRREIKNDEIQNVNAQEGAYDNSNSYTYGSDDDKPSDGLRSGAPDPDPGPANLGLSSAQAYAGSQVKEMNPYSFGYPPSPQSFSASALAQTSYNGLNGQSYAFAIEDAKSRLIWPHEYIFLHKIRGYENIVQCTRENELHHVWSRTFNCLVCICLNEYGLLEPVCASCAGCQKPAPPAPPPYITETQSPTSDSYKTIPIPDPYEPIRVPNSESPLTPPMPPTSLILEPSSEHGLESTTAPPVREVPATCSPLPTDQLFTNPLHPCQLCVCKEIVTAFGVDTKIDCQDNPQCVLPVDVTTLPPIPDLPIPVPLPLCEKFPPHVMFPHPSESCKQCECSIELSAAGVAEQQITCYHDQSCDTKPEASIFPTPPAPPIRIPVEPYPGPLSGPVSEPGQEYYPGPIAPDQSTTPGEPIAWPPITTPAPALIPLVPQKGPLPGPSPHESCRPYPPNQPFQHPWDECQVCQCSEAKASGMVNVEITCYTKTSCCIESPEQVITAIAGKNYFEAGGTAHHGVHQYLTNSLLDDQLSSTLKPLGLHSPGSIDQEISNKPTQPIPNLYQSASAFASVINDSPQISGELNTDSNNYQTSHGNQNLGIPNNQGYREPDSMVQNNLHPANNPIPGSYQSATAFINAINNGGQGLPEAETNTYPAPFNSPNQGYGGSNVIPHNYPLYNSLKSYPSLHSSGQPLIDPNIESNSYPSAITLQNHGYPEPNVLISQNNPPSNMPGSYAPPNGYGSMINGGQTSAESSAEYSNYSPSIGMPSNQPYLDSNAVGQSNPTNLYVSTTYKPPTIYGPYNPEITQNQAYAEAVVQYNDLMAKTQKPPTLYSPYNLGMSQNQVFGQSNGLYNSQKPNAHKTLHTHNQYNLGVSQNQPFGTTNAQYIGSAASTQRPTLQYSQYNPVISENAFASANSHYREEYTATDKPILPYNPYNTVDAQNQVYAEAMAQNSQNNQGFYHPDSYQSAKAVGNINAAEQPSVIASAITQSQDFGPYHQPGSQVGTNPESAPYQANYYTTYHQLSPYSGRPVQGMEGYKVSPIKYAGSYGFNGQADGISIARPQNGYYYGAGFSQNIPASNMYPSLYGKPNNYEIMPSYRPGIYGGQNGLVGGLSKLNTGKLQTKSGEGTDDTDDLE